MVATTRGASYRRTLESGGSQCCLCKVEEVGFFIVLSAVEYRRRHRKPPERRGSTLVGRHTM